MGRFQWPIQVGTGRIPAYYSGSPDYAGTVNMVRLTHNGDVVVTREPLAT